MRKKMKSMLMLVAMLFAFQATASNPAFAEPLEPYIHLDSTNMTVTVPYNPDEPVDSSDLNGPSVMYDERKDEFYRTYSIPHDAITTAGLASI